MLLFKVLRNSCGQMVVECKKTVDEKESSEKGRVRTLGRVQPGLLETMGLSPPPPLANDYFLV